MKYERTDCTTFIHHLWHNNKVTYYVKDFGSYYELELGVEGDTLETIRLENTADKETALNKTVAFLELFD